MSPKQKEPKIKESTRKSKKETDPDKPKKPLSGYMRFCNEKREQVKKENPDLKLTEISKKLGELWNELSEEEKKPYQQAYEADKDKYDVLLEEYKKTHPTGKKGSDPDKPKRPLSSYILFSNDKRDEVKSKNPDMNNKEITTLLGKMWKELSDDEKQKYEKQHEEEKKIYDEKMEEYKKNHPEVKEKAPKKEKASKTSIKKAPSDEDNASEGEESDNIFENESEYICLIARRNIETNGSQ